MAGTQADINLVNNLSAAKHTNGNGYICIFKLLNDVLEP